MDKTLEQIRKLFLEIATKHQQVDSFFWGDFNRATSEESLNYPLLLVDTVNANITRNGIAFTFQITVADSVLKGYENLNETFDDTLLVLKDVLDTMRSPKWKNFSSMQDSGTAERFFQRGADEVAGWYVRQVLTIHSPKDLCSIPFDPAYDFDGEFVSNCEPVDIFENGILVDSVASGGSYSYSTACDDGTNNVKKSDGVLIEAVTVPSGATINTTVSDSVITLNDSASALISTTNVKATDASTITAPDGTVNVNKSDSVLISAQTVVSNGTSNYNVSDSAISVNSTSLGNVKATDSLNITVVDSLDASVAVTLSGGNKITVPSLPCAGSTEHSSEVYKTGQTTSFRTGDDGDTEYGNGSTFYALGYDNGFGGGNQARFTDINGVDWTGAATGNIVLDWANWDRVNDTVAVWNIGYNGNDTWDNQIDWGLVDNLSTTYTGWHLANYVEIAQIIDHEISSLPTFFTTEAGDTWTSTTRGNSTTQAFYLQTGNRLNGRAKTNVEGGRQLAYVSLTTLGI